MSQNQSNTQTIVIAVVATIVILVSVVTLVNSNKPATNEMANNSSSMMKSDSISKSDTTVMVGGAAMYPSKDIVSNVSNASNLTTLVTAVKAADLVTTLQGPGPFTVFGPDNDAFAKLPTGTVETLVKPENKAKLTSILTYHVVPGIYKTSDLKDGQILKTVNGQDLKVSNKGGMVMINGAMIKTPDVLQSNGVAHVINSVLLPN